MWGESMLFWSRVAKVAQIGSGCIALREIVGLAKLRAIGVRAADKMQDIDNEMRRLRDSRDAMEASYRIFIGIVRYIEGAGRQLLAFSDKSQIYPFSRHSTIRRAAIDELVGSLSAEIPSAHACALDHSPALCAEQESYIRDRVDDFVASKRLSKESLDKAGRLQRTFIVAYILLWMCLLSFGAGASLYSNSGLALFLTLILGFLGFFPGMFVLDKILDRAYYWIRRPSVHFAKVGAALFNKSEPGHALLVVSFVILVGASLLDLLAT